MQGKKKICLCQPGRGKLVKSMVQFAADDDIDATLHDIKAALETGTYENKKWNWTETEDNVWNSTDPERSCTCPILPQMQS